MTSGERPRGKRGQFCGNRPNFSTKFGIFCPSAYHQNKFLTFDSIDLNTSDNESDVLKWLKCAFVKKKHMFLSTQKNMKKDIVFSDSDRV